MSIVGPKRQRIYISIEEDSRRLSCRNKTRRFINLTGVSRPACGCGIARTHAHHVDYGQPMLVAFLCHRCHADEHGGRRNGPLVVHDLRDLAVESLVAFV